MSEPLIFTYRNHRGEIAQRRVEPREVFFGSTKWHPEPQWFLRAIDLDKYATRYFAMNDMIGSTAIKLGPVDAEGGPNGREYIPLPGDWEIQTKGQGSTFRIADGQKQFPVMDTPFMHERLTKMARDIRAALGFSTHTTKPTAIEPPPVQPSVNAAATERAMREVARNRGFTGDTCTRCRSMAIVRNGTCLLCTECGNTTGCS